MKFQTSLSVIVTTICLLTIISNSDVKGLPKARTDSTQHSMVNAVMPACCDFNADACGPAYIMYFTWTKEYGPLIYIPPTNTGNYMWGYLPAEIEFLTILNVPTDALISFSYFLQSNTSYIQLMFYSETGGIVQVGGLITKQSDDWEELHIQCIDCCGVGVPTCDGIFTITASGLVVNSDDGVAIDNFGINGQCLSRMACCYFDDASACGYDIAESDWQDSLDSLPINPPDNPSGSNYMFHEPSPANATPYTASIRSLDTTINNDTIFSANLFVRTSAPNNALNVYFVWNDGIYGVQLGSVTNTYDMFRQSIFDCTVLKCCAIDSICTGHIEFSAYVEEIDSTSAKTDLFAVDAFEIAGSCGPFPGNNNGKHA